MTKNGTLTLRVDRDVRQRSEEILGRLGITLSGAIDMFLNQVVLTGGIPFPVKLPHREDGIASALDRGLAAMDASQIAAIVRHAAEPFEAIERVILFGSFARGEQTAQSDIDLRLELDETVPFGLSDLARFGKVIERMSGREVDLVTASQIRNPALARVIAQEGVVVYERS